MATATAERTERTTDKTLWRVMVRHSPFLLKSVDVEAATPDAAKTLFLEHAKKKMQERAAKVDLQRALDADTILKTKRTIYLAHEKAIEANQKNELEWIIRPAADVDRERAEHKAKVEKMWGKRVE